MASRRKPSEELPELPPEPGEEMESHVHRLGGPEESFGGFGAPGGGMGYVDRDVSIPIWEDAHRYSDGAYRLKIERVTPEGVTASLGFLPAFATEDQVIARGQGKPGTYIIMPVNEHNEPMRRQPYRRPIDEDHPAVRRYHASAAAGAVNSQVALLQGFGGGGGGLNPEFLGFFQSVLTAKDAEKDEMLAYLRQKDEEMARVREETSRMQLAVATDHTRNALEVQQKILEADQARQDFLQRQQLALLEKQREAERAAREAEAERSQSFYAAMLQQQQAAADAERARREDEQRRREEDLRRREQQMKEDEKRREAWMREQEAARQERAERERQRDREHMELVIKMLEKQHEVADPFKNVASLLEKGGQLKELLPALFGGDSAPQGVMGMLSTLAIEGMKTFAEIQKAQLQGGDDDDDDEIRLQSMPMTPEMAAQLQMTGQMPAGMLPDHMAQMTPEQIAAMQQAEAQAAYQAEMQRRMSAFAAPDAQPQAAPAAPQAAPQPAAVAPVPAAQTFEPPTVDLPDAVKKLDPATRKKAREAIRDLVATLGKVPEAQWQAAITQGIMATPQIIPYISAATIRAALLEGGATPELAQKVITAVDATGIVPASIPRG